MLLTADQAAAARKLWSAGLGTSELAAELGLTGDPVLVRSALLAVVQAPGAAPAKSPAARPKRVRKSDRYVVETDDERDDESDGVTDCASADDQQIPEAQRRQLVELNDETCKWPVGTVGEPDFFFCGARTASRHGDLGQRVRLPYCPQHCRRAYTGVTR